MRIQTSNKLAHLQAEYMEVSQQTACLENQVQFKRAQIAQLESYLCKNNGDRQMTMQYRKNCRELNTLCNKIARNKSRLANLQRGIQAESYRAQSGFTQPATRRPRKNYFY